DSTAGPFLIPSKQRAVARKCGSLEEGVDVITPGPDAVIRNRLTDDVNQENLRPLRGRVTAWRCRKLVDRPEHDRTVALPISRCQKSRSRTRYRTMGR